jgi:geranylgeranyl reductase family protein
MTMDYDVVVIGGGPAGLLAAAEVAKYDFNVMVMEEHAQIGVPDHCAGLLSTSGLQSLGLNPPSDVVQNHVIGARLHAPSGGAVEIERGKREALVVDRRLFDQWLADRARDVGVEISPNTKVTKMTHSNKMWILSTNSQIQNRAQIVINAEGARCVLSKSVGLPVVKRSYRLPAYQFEVTGADLDSQFVEMFYGRELAPGFFGWIIPISDGRARIGLASRDRSKMRLRRAMQRHKIISTRVKNATVERGLGGVVLVGLPVSQTHKDGLMVVGDAAGQVKPTTGGGVIMGGTAARIAGRTATRALEQNDATSDTLGTYTKSWKAAILRELQTMYVAQRGISSLSDKGLDILVTESRDAGLFEIVEREGDMDRQMSVITRLVRDPRMMTIGLRAIRYLNPFY